MQQNFLTSVLKKKLKNQKKHAIAFNYSHRIVTFKEGDVVMFVDPLRSSKLAPIYIGPCTIVKKTTGGAYRLLDTDGKLFDRLFAPSQLKIVSSDEKRSLSHVINRIIDHRGDKNHREYLVEWQEDDEQEWVKAEDR